MKIKMIKSKYASGTLLHEGETYTDAQVSSIDLRYLVQAGHAELVEEKIAEPGPAPVKIDPDEWTVARLKEELAELGVSIPNNAKKAELANLYEEELNK